MCLYWRQPLTQTRPRRERLGAEYPEDHAHHTLTQRYVPADTFFTATIYSHSIAQHLLQLT